MAITAQDVNRLRQITGAGMMDCKKALSEAEGDFDLAIEVLRKKGQKVSANRADRDAREGAVFIKENAAGNEAILIELNCETDFVARNEDFQGLGNLIANAAEANSPADLDALRALVVEGTSIEERISSSVGKIGEKIDVSRYERISGDKVVSYIHPGARVGVVVAFGNVQQKDATSVGKDVAMQIAAMNPIALDKDDVPADVITKEIEIGKELAINEGKPAAMAEKIALGRLNKFYKDNTLLNQDFVKDTSKTVGDFVKESLGAEVKVTAFKRVQLGAS